MAGTLLISLVVATINRTRELDGLLDSLDTQTSTEFEVLIVDQNQDDRVESIIRRHPKLSIRRLRCEPGLSRARNVALRHVAGDIVSFPDDDCWYPPGLLHSVKEFFAQRLDLEALFVTLRDASNNTIGPPWRRESCFWSKDDVWTNGISAAGFLRRNLVNQIGFFDERLGVGAPTPYQSGEDADYFIRILERGHRIWFEPGLTVHHPSFHRIERMKEITYGYSLGGGYTLRAHKYPARRFLKSFVRSVGGCVVNLLKGRFVLSYTYVLRAAGITRGYVLGPRDLAKLSTCSAESDHGGRSPDA